MPQVLEVGMAYCDHHHVALSELEVERNRCKEKKCPHFGVLKRIVRF